MSWFRTILRGFAQDTVDRASVRVADRLAKLLAERARQDRLDILQSEVSASLKEEIRSLGAQLEEARQEISRLRYPQDLDGVTFEYRGGRQKVSK